MSDRVFQNRCQIILGKAVKIGLGIFFLGKQRAREYGIGEALSRAIA